MAESGEFLGFGLNVSQRLAVKSSLAKLRLSEKNPSIAFWGKVSGSARDYFIAQGVSATDCIAKTYFFSADGGITFSKMAEVDDFVREKVGAVRGLFTGNPANQYKDPNAKAGEEEEEEEPEPEEDEGDDNKAPDPSKRKLTELERLAHTVQSIDADTCVVPRGKFVMDPTGMIVSNAGYAGLTGAEASKTSNYLLFRDPQSPVTLAKIRKVGVSNNLDFLDTIVEGKPSGVWTVQVDGAITQAKLRSLVWPGYEYKLEVGSAAGVGAYFGNGMKNEDVMFML